MIKNIIFGNFYSFCEETIIDFSLGKKPTPSGFDIIVDNQRYNKVIAIVGANGAGKTQLLKPLAFLSWFVSKSFLNNDPEADIPCEPHRLNVGEPSYFQLEFSLNNTDYRYELDIKNKSVEYEALFEKTSTQYSYLFKREHTEQGFQYKQKGFSFPKAQAERTRSNTSILGAAHSYDIPEAKPFIDFFERINSFNVASSGRRHIQPHSFYQSAELIHDDPEWLQIISMSLCEFDLGLSDIEIREKKSIDRNGKDRSIFVPYGIHTTEDKEKFELPFWEESSGTQSAFVLVIPILQTLANGGIVVIDELDNDLHPHLIPVLLEWFEFKETNPHHAQLIFTCHAPEVLNLLQKHQVYLVEKQNQRSEAWRLDEVTGLRADDNLYAKYMAGALGATPKL